jgi:hypothetical protein
MGFHFRRSIKLVPGIRAGVPESGLCSTHVEETRVIGFVASGSSPSLNSNALPGRDWRGLLWIGLVVFAIAVAAVQAMN